MIGIKRIHPKYLIIAAELFADLGNLFVALILLDGLIFRGQHALSNLLVLCLLEQGPSIFLSPLAGLWMDRLGIRKWLTIVNVGKCLSVGLLAFTSSPWIIFPVYLCFKIGSVFFHIGRLSLTPLLIPKEEIISFNSLNERVSLAGTILGPWLIGWVVLRTGQGFALALAGLLFTLSVCTICGLPRRGRTSKGSSAYAKEGGGLKTLFLDYRKPFRDNQYLSAHFLAFGFVLLGGGVLNIGLPILFKTNLGTNIAHWGLIMSGFQAGSCAATFLLPRWSSARRQETILSLTFLILGGAMAVLSQVTTYTQIALLMALMGCGFTLMHVFLESLIQQHSPRASIGKTISVLSTYKGLCYLGSMLGSVLVLRIWTPQSLLLTVSALMVSACFIVNRLCIPRVISLGDVS